MSKRFRDSSEHQNEAAPEPERRSPGRQTLSGVLLRSVRGDRGGPSGAGGGVPDALRWTGPRDADAPVVDAGALAGGVPLAGGTAAETGAAVERGHDTTTTVPVNARRATRRAETRRRLLRTADRRDVIGRER